MHKLKSPLNTRISKISNLWQKNCHIGIKYISDLEDEQMKEVERKFVISESLKQELNRRRILTYVRDLDFFDTKSIKEGDCVQNVFVEHGNLNNKKEV